jgi:hypothetical protein
VWFISNVSYDPKLTEYSNDFVSMVRSFAA